MFSINPDKMKVEMSNNLTILYQKLLEKNKKIQFNFNDLELSNLRVHYNKFNSQFDSK